MRRTIALAGAAVLALPAAASAATPRVVRACPAPHALYVSTGGLAKGSGGRYWAVGSQNRFGTFDGPQRLIHFTASCAVGSIASPRTFRPSTLVSSLGGAVWISGDDGTSFRTLVISGLRTHVYPADQSIAYGTSLAVQGRRALWVGGGRQSWFTSPTRHTPVTYASAPALGAVAAGRGRIWLTAAGAAGYLLPGAADVTLLTHGMRAGFSASAVVVLHGRPWFLEADAGGHRRLGTAVGASVRDYGIPAGGSEIAVGAGAVWVANTALSRALRLGPTGRVTGSVAMPRGYRLITLATVGSYLGVIATQPNDGSGPGLTKLLLVR